MLKTLLKKQLAEINQSFFYDRKKGKARSKVTSIIFVILYALLLVCAIGGMFTYLALTMCKPMVDAGLDWMYFAIIGMIAIALGIFGSVFNTYSGLYLAKDNDMLLSMPIPVHTLMVSRLLSVYLMGLMYAGVVIVPAVAVYLFCVPLTFGALIGCLLLDYLVPFTLIGLAGLFRERELPGWVGGAAFALSLRLLSHFFSGAFIFASAGLVMNINISNPYLYSLVYNAAYMVPEIAFTCVACFVLFKIPSTRRLLTEKMPA